MAKPIKDLTAFQTIFLGEYVSITINLKSKMVHTTEEQTIEQEIPVSVRGYLLEIDNHYLYLGDNPNEVHQAVKEELVAHIEIVQEEDMFSHILDEMPDPSKKDIN